MKDAQATSSEAELGEFSSMCSGFATCCEHAVHACARTREPDPALVEAAPNSILSVQSEPRFVKIVLRRRAHTEPLPRHRHQARRWPDEEAHADADLEEFI